MNSKFFENFEEDFGNDTAYSLADNRYMYKHFYVNKQHTSSVIKDTLQLFLMKEKVLRLVF